MSAFVPLVKLLHSKHPRMTKMVLAPLTVMALAPAVLGMLPAAWQYMMSYLMTSLVIPKRDVQLQNTFKTWLESRKLSLFPERSVIAQSSTNLFQTGDPRIAGAEPQNLYGAVFFQDRNTFQFFWHEKRFYIVSGGKPQQEDLTVWTMGWSPAPINALLAQISAKIKSERSRSTFVNVPDHGDWLIQSVKASPPLDSVYLPAGVKEGLVSDIEEYLSPVTKNWYNARRIPWRRGYLMYGAPGAGKSSTALALAGHFHMEVYSLSLLDPMINDRSLIDLFNKLPPRCIVLLEDVEGAGIGRESSIAPEAPESKKGSKIRPASRVTLSGLLNAINGPCSPEGHVLFMTTNCPDSLDDALIRPGRIDVRIEFKQADAAQIRQIFKAMYLAHEPADTTEEQKKDVQQKNEELVGLADEFADLVPEFTFSPAALQTYFMLHKTSAQEACDHIEAWVDMKIYEAESKSFSAIEAAAAAAAAAAADGEMFVPGPPGSGPPMMMMPSSSRRGGSKKGPSVAEIGDRIGLVILQRLTLGSPAKEERTAKCESGFRTPPTSPRIPAISN